MYFQDTTPGSLAEAEREFAIRLVENLPSRVVRQLTPIEQEILILIAAGLSNKEISSALNKTDRTINNQVQTILEKFDVHSRCHLIARLHVIATGPRCHTEIIGAAIESRFTGVEAVR